MPAASATPPGGGSVLVQGGGSVLVRGVALLLLRPRLMGGSVLVRGGGSVLGKAGWVGRWERVSGFFGGFQAGFDFFEFAGEFVHSVFDVFAELFGVQTQRFSHVFFPVGLSAAVFGEA